MWPKFGNTSISMRKVIITSVLWGFDKKGWTFEGWPWFKFNNLGLALGMDLKCYTSVAKESKLKVRKFCELISTFLEVTGEKLIGGFLGPPASWIRLKNPLSDMISCSFSIQLITSDNGVRYWPRIYSLNINFNPIGGIPTKGFPVCVLYILRKHCTKIIMASLLKLIFVSMNQYATQILSPNF